MAFFEILHHFLKLILTFINVYEKQILLLVHKFLSRETNDKCIIFLSSIIHISELLQL